MALNKGQQKLVNYIKNWWRCNQTYLVVDSKAGTGKTYAINYAIKQLTNCEPLLLCTTNEALTQLIEKVDNPEDYTFKTVHSALRITPTLGKKELEFEHIAIPSLWEDFNLAVVDESSTLDDLPLDLLISIGMKIIFVGHSSQLPPIVEKRKRNDPCISPVFSKGWETITLTQPMRNTGDLWEFNNKVEEMIYNPKLLLPTNYDIKKKELRSYVSSKEGIEDFLNGTTKMVAWSNNGVDNLNKELRLKIFGKASLEHTYLPGDKIILTKPYVVTDIEKCNEIKLKRLMKDRDNLEILYSNTKATVVNSTFVEIKLNQFLKFVFHRIQINSYGRLYFIYEPATKDIIYKIAEYYEHIAWGKKTKQAKTKAYKERHFILSCFAEVKHYFAATSHRLQGASIPKVIVMHSDIMKNMNVVERAKCRYVACSRAIDSLMIYRGI